MPHLSCITPGKETQYPLYRRLGRSQHWSGWVRKISPSPGFDLQIIQPVLYLVQQLRYPGSDLCIISEKAIKDYSQQ
jgi:hypothetical protein